MPGRVAAALMTALLLLGSAMAQEPEAVEPQGEEPDPRDVGRGPEEPARSVTDSIMMSRRSHFGVALGATGAYTSNIYAHSERPQGSAMTVPSARVFTNFGSRRTRLHAEYGYAYRFYHRFSGLDTDSHQLNLDYSFLLNRKVTFYAYERLDNSVNDSFSLFSPGFGFSGGPSLSTPNEYIRGRQKVFRNDSAVGLGWQVTRHGTLSATMGYQTWRYHIESFADMSAAYAFLSYSHQFKKWLNLSSSYMTYFTDVNRLYTDRQIHRLQVGNFSFKLSRRWETSLHGGVDYSRGGYQYGSITTGSGGASLSHTSRANTFSLRYFRGLSTYFGEPGVFASNFGSLSFVQRLASRVSAECQGYYQWGRLHGSAGKLEYYGGTASLEYGLRADLVASLNYTYRNQKSSTPGGTPWNFDRSVAYLAVTWFWPTQ